MPSLPTEDQKKSIVILKQTSQGTETEGAIETLGLMVRDAQFEEITTIESLPDGLDYNAVATEAIKEIKPEVLYWEVNQEFNLSLVKNVVRSATQLPVAILVHDYNVLRMTQILRAALPEDHLFTQRTSVSREGIGEGYISFLKPKKVLGETEVEDICN